MDNVSVSDTDSNLLVTGSSEAAVDAALRDLVALGATISTQPSPLGFKWTASCTRPLTWGRSESVNGEYLKQLAQRAATRAALQNVTISDAGAQIIVSGPDEVSVRAALLDLVEQGSRIKSDVTKVGTKWIAYCEHPDIALSECTVEKVGFNLFIQGPSKAAVEAKVSELAETGAMLISAIEEMSGQWSAVCDVAELHGSSWHR